MASSVTGRSHEILEVNSAQRNIRECVLVCRILDGELGEAKTTSSSLTGRQVYLGIQKASYALNNDLRNTLGN